jgi:hypothetical protein
VAERKKLLLRLDPAIHDAVARWAGDELRSTNAQIEFLLRRALSQSGRLPDNAGHLPRRGRPPRDESPEPSEPDPPSEPELPSDPAASPASLASTEPSNPSEPS